MPVLLGVNEATTQRQRLDRAAGDKLDFDFELRKARYNMNRAMLDNSVYLPEARNGYREQVLKDYFQGIECPADAIVSGVYNPTKTIVAAYQNVFRGKWGQEIKVDELYDEKPVNPKLIGPDSPLRRLWRWSNLDTQKFTLQEWAANFGTVGLRVVSRDNTDEVKRRVYIQIDHPSVISDFNEDDRGNVTEVEIKYHATVGELGEKRRVVEVREIITKTRFSREVDGKEVLEADEQRNALGVCPYVILRHRDSGQAFGRWAYEGSEPVIHWLNWIITNQGQSIVKHVWPKWFAAASGPKPENIDTGGKEQVTYVRLEQNGATPIFVPLVAPLDQAGALAYAVEFLDRLHERQPEIILGQVKALAGQSGETIAKLLIPVEAAVLQARSQYEDALIRAKKIGLSEGVRIGLWDLGAGAGGVDEAERTYGDGLEEFAFAERPALPQSVYDLMQQAKSEVAPKLEKINLGAAGAKLELPRREKWRLAGYTEAEMDQMDAELAEQDELEADDEEDEEGFGG